MELFNKNKKENKNEEEKLKIEASGWDAIDEEAKRIYPGQDKPKHYAPLIKWRLGGPDPLDGISVYDGGDYWHFVTYGLSELYEKESKNKQWSGYGMEFTFKLKKDNYVDEEQEIKCVCGLLQQIARITFENGEIFNPYEYLYTGQTEGIDARRVSKITGFITIPDTKFQTLNTKNGRVDFVEFIGVTNNELLALKNKEIDVKTLYNRIGTDITDYNRNKMSIYDYKVKNRSGKEISIADFKGKVLIIVNTATGCGFTPQYEGLEKLYKKYHEKGLEVLDFPCNQFGNQAPGTDDEIHKFCQFKYNTSFDQFAKIDVNGENESQLYTYIKNEVKEDIIEGMKNKIAMKTIEKISSTYKKDGDIKWNFTKFLVDRDGNVVSRYSPIFSPEDMEEKIKELL